MRARRAAPPVAFAVLVCSFAPDLHAFCRTTTCDARTLNDPRCETDLNGCAARGTPLFWPERCIRLAVQEDGSSLLGMTAERVQQMVTDAAEQWTGADCNGSPPSVRFVDAGLVSCDHVEYNPGGPNANIVAFRDSEWSHGFATIALTTVTFNVDTGEIRGADMELNSQLIQSSNLAPELGMILTHELGHVLGLSHSPLSEAIMFPTYQERADLELAWDDVQGVCAVYTPGRAVPACDPQEAFDTRCGGNVAGSCALGAGASREQGVAALAALGLVLAGVRRLTSRRRA